MFLYLLKNTVTNGERVLFRSAFSAVLVIVQSIIPSGVSGVQDLVGDSKELQKAKRMCHAFVRSTTFRIPTLFSLYVLLNKMYGIQSSLSYENLVSRWSYVMLIYTTQEVSTEIPRRIVYFLVSRKWKDYHGRFSYPKIMFKHYQEHRLYVCTAFQLSGSTLTLHVMKLFNWSIQIVLFIILFFSMLKRSLTMIFLSNTS